MSTKAVVGWLVVAVVLGLGVILAFRGGGGSSGGIAVNDRVLVFNPTSVRRITVGPAGSPPDIVDRSDAADGGWVLRLGGAKDADISWPVPAARADALLTIMSESRAVALPERASELGDAPTEVILERVDGGPITIRFAERTIGGIGLVEITTRDDAGQATTRAMVDDKLHRAVRDRGARGWRDRAAMPWARADLSRIRLERGDLVVALGRNEGRWSLREPFAAPADNAAVQQMLSGLGSAEIVEFIDDGAPGIDTGIAKPQARVIAEVDRSNPEAATDRPAISTLRYSLDIGGPADGTGTQLFALIDGQRLVKIGGTGLSKLTLEPGAYLSPHPTSVAANGVGMIVLERLDAKGVPTDDGRILKRSLDRWVEFAEGVAPKALPDEEVKEIAAALAFLTGTDAPASARPEIRTTPPEAYRAGARISLRSLDDAPLAVVEVGMSTVSALTAVKSGDVYRVYPLDRLPKLISSVMQASPAINPPRQGDTKPDENK